MDCQRKAYRWGCPLHVPMFAVETMVVATSSQPGRTAAVVPLPLSNQLSMHIPDPQHFAALAIEHDFVPVYRRLLSDALTPVTAFQLLDDGGPACLFESVIGGEKVGRYSFLAASPVRRFAATRERIEITELPEGTTHAVASRPILWTLFDLTFIFGSRPLTVYHPFVGGAIGYAGYDVVRYVEDLPNAPQDDRGSARP